MISSSPTLMVIRDGIALYLKPGALPKPVDHQGAGAGYGRGPCRSRGAERRSIAA